MEFKVDLQKGRTAQKTNIEMDEEPQPIHLVEVR